MTNYTLFWLIACGHILGDFYFQTAQSAYMKNKKNSRLKLHWIVYVLCVSGALMPVMNLETAFAAAILILSHLLIDAALRPLLTSFFSKKYAAFLVDQTLHLLIIIAVLMLNPSSALNTFGRTAVRVFSSFLPQTSRQFVLRAAVLALLLGKPSNILVRLVCRQGQSDEENAADDSSPEAKTGRYIGLLERYLIAVFIAINSFSSIGFVLTAKSIARFDQISKDRMFAEYYLIGTLLSAFIAIALSAAVLP